MTFTSYKKWLLSGLIVPVLTLTGSHLGHANGTTVPGAPAPKSEAEGEYITLEQFTAEVFPLRGEIADVFVANPELVDVQVTSTGNVYVFAKKPGATNIYSSDVNGEIILNLKVRVIHNLSRLKQAIQSIAPGENIQVSSMPGGLVLSGSVSTPQLAEDVRIIVERFLMQGDKLVNRLQVTSINQVSLKVKVAEVKRESLNRLGFSWNLVSRSTSSNFLFGVLNGANPLISTATGPGAAASFNQITAGESTAIGGRFTRRMTDVSALLDALSTESLATILAEPNLVALSGETASFLSGGEFPFPVPSDEGISIEFKEVGIRLAFTPTVISNNLIHMRVRPEVSEISSDGNVTISLGGNNSATVPSINTRRAETSVELASGQSFAIAGLLSRNSINAMRKIPGLGDLPILGSFFRNARSEREERELVIIVTPYLVKPSTPDALRTPLDGLKMANHFDMMFDLGAPKLNIVEKNLPPQGSTSEIYLVGDAGFDVDLEKRAQ